jgi:hypothetical protein
VLRTYIFETTTIASVLTILTFTSERWLHICRPMYAKKFSSGFSRVLKIIILIWVVSGCLALPYSFTSGVYYEYQEFVESKTCGIYERYRIPMTFVIQLSVLFLFIIPMTLISIMYVFIGVTLWKSQLKHAGASAAVNYGQQGNQNASSPKKSGLLAKVCCWRGKANKKSSGSEFSSIHNTAMIDLRINGCNVNESSNSMFCSNMNLNSHASISSGNGHTSQLNVHNIRKSVSATLPGKSASVSGPSANNNNNNKTHLLSLSTNLGLPRVASEISVSECSNMMNPSMNVNDRTSKEFEHISYRARQSRRDVVKMLCKSIIIILLDVYLHL